MRPEGRTEPGRLASVGFLLLLSPIFLLKVNHILAPGEPTHSESQIHSRTAARLPCAEAEVPSCTECRRGEGCRQLERELRRPQASHELTPSPTGLSGYEEVREWQKYISP